MPLIKEWKATPHGFAAIWKIEEEEAFFTNYTGLKSDIKNDQRRMEYQAGRFLLRYLEEDVPVHTIAHDEHGKPRVENNEYYFSISHSWPYVVAIIDPVNEAGIDIQKWHNSIGNIKHKFLSPAEQEIFGDDNQLLTLAWTVKEALYKWNGKKGVGFISHLSIEQYRKTGNKYEMTIYSKMRQMPQMIYVESIIMPDFSCSWVINTQDWAIY